MVTEIMNIRSCLASWVKCYIENLTGGTLFLLRCVRVLQFFSGQNVYGKSNVYDCVTTRFN